MPVVDGNGLRMENKIRRLGIDDCRELLNCDVVARTYEEGVRALMALGHFDELYLDHDLCSVKTCENNGREMTGYDVVVFLEWNPEYRPGKVILVTQNPVGRQKMVEALKRMYGELYDGN
jgi:hypothetical protein